MYSLLFLAEVFAKRFVMVFGHCCTLELWIQYNLHNREFAACKHSQKKKTRSNNIHRFIKLCTKSNNYLQTISFNNILQVAKLHRLLGYYCLLVSLCIWMNWWLSLFIFYVAFLLLANFVSTKKILRAICNIKKTSCRAVLVIIFVS